MKRIKGFFIAALLLMAGQVFAEDVVTVKTAKGSTDFVVAPEEEFDVVVYLDNESKNFTTYFEMYLVLPAGFSYVNGSAIFNTARGSYGDEVFVYRSGDYCLYCETTDSEHWDDALKGTSGELFRFKLKAPATASEDPFVVKIRDIAFSDEDFETVNIGDVSFNVTVGEATAETVEITLGNASGYNTYVSDKDLDFTGLDAKAYIVSAVSATEATLSPVDAIKAGEGFIIQGAGEATIEVPVAAETPAASGTLLATGQPLEGDYLLAKDGSSFVLWDGTGTLAATKAYLPASAISSGAKIINIAFGESTGISEVKKSEADGAIYNLSGMRVSKTQKGVYIMNGRKVIVK